MKPVQQASIPFDALSLPTGQNRLTKNRIRPRSGARILVNSPKSPLTSKRVNHANGSIALILLVLASVALLVYGWIAGHIPKTPERAANRWYEIDAPLICKRMLIKAIYNPKGYREVGDPIIDRDNGSRKEMRWVYTIQESPKSKRTAICVISKDSKTTFLTRQQ